MVNTVLERSLPVVFEFEAAAAAAAVEELPAAPFGFAAPVVLILAY